MTKIQLIQPNAQLKTNEINSKKFPDSCQLININFRSQKNENS